MGVILAAASWSVSPSRVATCHFLVGFQGTRVVLLMANQRSTHGKKRIRKSCKRFRRYFRERWGSCIEGDILKLQRGLGGFQGKIFFLRVGASSGDLQWVEEEILGRVRDIHYCWGELVDIFLEAGRILGRVLKLEQEVFLEVWVSWRSEISWGSKLHREFLRESLQTEEEKFVLWSHQKHHFESGAFSFLKIPLHSLLI